MFLKHGCDVARDPGTGGCKIGCVEVTHANKIQEYPRLVALSIELIKDVFVILYIRVQFMLELQF